jgi:hypothetical protein
LKRTTKEQKHKKTTNEVAEKETEEEQHKKDEEARNDDASLMDIDILEISTIGANGHTQFSGLGLWGFVPHSNQAKCPI